MTNAITRTYNGTKGYDYSGKEVPIYNGRDINPFALTDPSILDYIEVDYYNFGLDITKGIKGVKIA